MKADDIWNKFVSDDQGVVRAPTADSRVTQTASTQRSGGSQVTGSQGMTTSLCDSTFIPSIIPFPHTIKTLNLKGTTIDMVVVLTGGLIILTFVTRFFSFEIHVQCTCITVCSKEMSASYCTTLYKGTRFLDRKRKRGHLFLIGKVIRKQTKVSIIHSIRLR